MMQTTYVCRQVSVGSISISMSYVCVSIWLVMTFLIGMYLSTCACLYGSLDKFGCAL